MGGFSLAALFAHAWPEDEAAAEGVAGFFSNLLDFFASTAFCGIAMTRSVDLADIKTSSSTLLTLSVPGTPDPSASIDLGYGYGFDMGIDD